MVNVNSHENLDSADNDAVPGNEIASDGVDAILQSTQADVSSAFPQISDADLLSYAEATSQMTEEPEAVSQMTEDPEVALQSTEAPGVALQSTAAVPANTSSFSTGKNVIDMDLEATRVGKSALGYGGLSAVGVGGLTAAQAIAAGATPSVVAALAAPAAVVGGVSGAVAGATTYGLGMLHNVVWKSRSNPKPMPNGVGTFLRGAVSGVTIPVGLVYRRLLGIGN